MVLNITNTLIIFKLVSPSQISLSSHWSSLVEGYLTISQASQNLRLTKRNPEFTITPPPNQNKKFLKKHIPSQLFNNGNFRQHPWVPASPICSYPTHYHVLLFLPPKNILNMSTPLHPTTLINVRPLSPTLTTVYILANLFPLAPVFSSLYGRIIFKIYNSDDAAPEQKLLVF